MSRISLRQLAKQYADGSLDQESYRRARADYLHTIIEGEEPPGSLTQASYTSPKAVAGEETVTAAALHDKEQKQKISEQDPAPAEHLQTTPIQLTDNSRNPVYISAGIIAAILVIVILASLLFGGKEAERAGAAEDSSQATAAPAEPETASMQPLADSNSNNALAMLKEFLDSPAWNQQALDDFADRWQELPRDERETALQTTLARQLSDALYRQLLEERALQGLDEDGNTSLAGQEKIVDFARAIGLKDRRLEVETVN